MWGKYESLGLTEDIGKITILFRDSREIGYSIGRGSSESTIRSWLDRELYRAFKLASMVIGCSVDEGNWGCLKTGSLRRVGQGRRQD